MMSPPEEAPSLSEEKNSGDGGDRDGRVRSANVVAGSLMPTAPAEHFTECSLRGCGALVWCPLLAPEWVVDILCFMRHAVDVWVLQCNSFMTTEDENWAVGPY